MINSTENILNRQANRETCHPGSIPAPTSVVKQDGKMANRRSPPRVIRLIGRKTFRQT